MLNVAVYDDFILEAIGIPTIFFADEDLYEILHNDAARADLIRTFSNGVCVGRLGKLIKDVYVENNLKDLVLIDDITKGDLSYYDRL